MIMWVFFFFLICPCAGVAICQSVDKIKWWLLNPDCRRRDPKVAQQLRGSASIDHTFKNFISFVGI